ncbi:hypothetical protein, partial [Promicromonospora kroppenstedtii]|uniref:hypothetical protein n=1 Tax=Promicromonospora kroppenstedtii TaxID=440482 RepID=UPI00056A1FA6
MHLLIDRQAARFDHPGPDPEEERGPVLLVGPFPDLSEGLAGRDLFGHGRGREGLSHPAEGGLGATVGAIGGVLVLVGD